GAEIDAVPATVGRSDAAVGGRSRAVEEGLGTARRGIAVVAAVVVQVPVRLLEREQMRAVVGAGGIAVRGVGGGGGGERRRNVDDRCADDEAARGPCAGAEDCESGDHDGGARGGHAPGLRAALRRCQRFFDGPVARVVSTTATRFATSALRRCWQKTGGRSGGDLPHEQLGTRSLAHPIPPSGWAASVS